MGKINNVVKSVTSDTKTVVNKRSTAKSVTSKKTEQKRIVSIDITRFYDKIKEYAEEDIRSIQEEILFLLKEGIEHHVRSGLPYISHGYVRQSPSFQPKPLFEPFPKEKEDNKDYPWYVGRDLIYCGDDGSYKISASTEDRELNSVGSASNTSSSPTSLNLEPING